MSSLLEPPPAVPVRSTNRYKGDTVRCGPIAHRDEALAKATSALITRLAALYVAAGYPAPAQHGFGMGIPGFAAGDGLGFVNAIGFLGDDFRKSAKRGGVFVQDGFLHRGAPSFEGRDVNRLVFHALELAAFSVPRDVLHRVPADAPVVSGEVVSHLPNTPLHCSELGGRVGCAHDAGGDSSSRRLPSEAVRGRANFGCQLEPEMP